MLETTPRINPVELVVAMMLAETFLCLKKVEICVIPSPETVVDGPREPGPCFRMVEKPTKENCYETVEKKTLKNHETTMK